MSQTTMTGQIIDTPKEESRANNYTMNRRGLMKAFQDGVLEQPKFGQSICLKRYREVPVTFEKPKWVDKGNFEAPEGIKIVFGDEHHRFHMKFSFITAQRANGEVKERDVIFDAIRSHPSKGVSYVEQIDTVVITALGTDPKKGEYSLSFRSENGRPLLRKMLRSNNMACFLSGPPKITEDPEYNDIYSAVAAFRNQKIRENAEKYHPDGLLFSSAQPV